MATIIESGSIPLPYVLGVIPGQTSDMSQTGTHRITLMMAAGSLNMLRVGAPAPGVGGAYIASVGNAKRITGDIWEAEVNAIDSPRDYDYTDLQSVTFLPFIGMASPATIDPEKAKALSSKAQAITVMTQVAVAVRFTQTPQTVRAQQTPPPSFDGAFVNFFGHVFNGDGVYVGTTSPFSPPSEVIVSQNMEPFQAGFFKVTTTTARRPRGV